MSNPKIAFLASVLAMLLAHTGLAWGGEILTTVSNVPSFLTGPLGLRSKALEEHTTRIVCYSIFTGAPLDCGYDFTVTGLAEPAADVANNGGHTHDLTIHPAGSIRVTAPVPGPRSTFLTGQTTNATVVVSHDIPMVSGKIRTVLNLRVPPGWFTVTPESLDDTRTSWRFVTTIDVGVSGLVTLPDGSPVYVKRRSPDTAHTDAVAFSGTADAVAYLTAIAETYNDLTNNLLSVNDMSLPRGGLFDWQAKDGTNIYAPPHSWHRTGQSADINRTQGDCRQNHDLKTAVALVMPAEPGSVFAQRGFDSVGRFLCEASGNIHIDFDVIAPSR